MNASKRGKAAAMWRYWGAAAAALALVVAAGCGAPQTAGTAAAADDVTPASQTSAPQSSSESAAEPTQTSPVTAAPSALPTDEGLGGGGGGGTGDCPDTESWTTDDKLTELTIGGPIVGFSGGSVGCFDSFNILLDATDGEPGFSVKYVDQVTQPGSGDPVPVDGGAVLEVVIGAPAYDLDTAEETVHIPDQRSVIDTSGFFAMEQVVYGGSFEGMTTFAIGVTAKLPFAVDLSATGDGRPFITISVAHAPSGGFGPEDEADNADEYGSLGCDDAASWDAAAQNSELLMGGEILSVYSAVFDCYDTVVIVSRNTDDAPGFVVEYVDEVTEDGSGHPVPVSGGAALQVVVAAPAYDSDTGDFTLVLNDREHMVDVQALTAVQQVAFAGSFEGMTRLAIGVDQQRPFTVESGVDNAGSHYLAIHIAHSG